MLCISRIIAGFLFLASASATTYHEPQPADILGGLGLANPTPDYQPFFPIIYVVFGPQGIPHVRSIIDRNDDCPNPLKDPTIMKTLYDGKSPINSLGESLSDPDKLPYRFPVRVCEAAIQKDSELFKDIQAGAMKLLFNNQTYDVPAVKTNPKKFLLLGDTGMRVHPTNLGLGKLGKDNTKKGGGANCTAPEVYGVAQCYTNFTEADLTETPTGSFQGTDEWFFKEIADHAAKEEVDVIVSVGDYLYRQGPCPDGAVNSKDGKVKNCSVINTPSYSDEALQGETIMNFIPGQYGDNWWGWWADWFYPTLNLLKSAPIIPTRGNHEICTRGGFGYFLFMFPHDVDNRAENHCFKDFPPYSVKFEKEQFLVMDDSPIEPLGGGVDHFIVSEEGCPGAPSDGTPIVPVQKDRYLDPSKADLVPVQIERFTAYFKQFEELSQDSETNFYVAHRPLLGIGCDNTSIVTLDWTLQQSLGPTTLDRISGLISGHMHWLEVLEFENNILPAQIIVGNGGTMLLENKINQTAIPYVDLKVGMPEYNISARVKRGLTLSAFGYGVMERQDDDGYEVIFSVYKPDLGQMESLDFTLSIPAGSRPVPSKKAIKAVSSSSPAPFAFFVSYALVIFTPLALLSSELL